MSCYNNRRPTKKRGQIAQEYLIATWILLGFILVILAAENHYLPEILKKQLAEKQRLENIYNCAVIDTMATFNSTGINYTAKNLSNLHCISSVENIIGEGTQTHPFERYNQLD